MARQAQSQTLPASSRTRTSTRTDQTLRPARMQRPSTSSARPWRTARSTTRATSAWRRTTPACSSYAGDAIGEKSTRNAKKPSLGRSGAGATTSACVAATQRVSPTATSTTPLLPGTRATRTSRATSTPRPSVRTPSRAAAKIKSLSFTLWASSLIDLVFCCVRVLFSVCVFTCKFNSSMFVCFCFCV